jgi:hypothetical protein
MSCIRHVFCGFYRERTPALSKFKGRIWIVEYVLRGAELCARAEMAAEHVAANCAKGRASAPTRLPRGV